jgi:hypothetical protein
MSDSISTIHSLLIITVKTPSRCAPLTSLKSFTLFAQWASALFAPAKSGCILALAYAAHALVYARNISSFSPFRSASTARSASCRARSNQSRGDRSVIPSESFARVWICERVRDESGGEGSARDIVTKAEAKAGEEEKRQAEERGSCKGLGEDGWGEGHG